MSKHVENGFVAAQQNIFFYFFIFFSYTLIKPKLLRRQFHFVTMKTVIFVTIHFVDTIKIVTSTVRVSIDFITKSFCRGNNSFSPFKMTIRFGFTAIGGDTVVIRL